MRFLEINEIAEWCREAGLRVSDDFKVEFPKLLSTARLVYENGGYPSKAAKVGSECMRALGDWNEALLWITGWGVWESNENWPEFFGWRGKFNERRSLGKAPAHLFTQAEASELEWLLTKNMQYGWDAKLLLTTGGKINRNLVQISHDGFIDLLTA